MSLLPHRSHSGCFTPRGPVQRRGFTGDEHVPTSSGGRGEPRGLARTENQQHSWGPRDTEHRSRGHLASTLVVLCGGSRDQGGRGAPTGAGVTEEMHGGGGKGQRPRFPSSHPALAVPIVGRACPGGGEQGAEKGSSLTQRQWVGTVPDRPRSKIMVTVMGSWGESSWPRILPSYLLAE